MPTTTEHAGGRVLEVSLARPPANALSPESILATRDAIRAAADTHAALVLSGAPGMFSAGLDIPAFLGLDRDGVREAWRGFFALMRSLAASPIPVAAAVTGHAPAGGCVLAMCCDWRVFAEGKYKIGLNEVQVGVRIPLPILVAARAVVGARQAARLCTTAALIEPEEAARIGLVDELAPVEDVVPRAVAWAEAMCALPPHALRESRALTQRELVDSIDAIGSLGERAHSEELERFLDEWFADECQGALRAVVERLAAKKKG